MNDTNENYLDAQRFRPTTTRVRPVWERLNAAAKARRYGSARRCERRFLEVHELIAGGAQESTAVAQVEPPLHRSTYRNWARRHATFGFEGLIDCRMPAPPESVSDSVEQLVCALRRADRSIGVEQIVSFVRNHHDKSVSVSSVKRILKRSGLHRRVGRPQGGGRPSGKELRLGGMKLIEAVAFSTGYLQAQTKTVVDHVASLSPPPDALGPDREGRDENGRFLASYNERYRRRDGDAVGPGFASVEEKRRVKDPSLFHVHGASEEVVERKLWALMCSPLIGTGGWDGMRTPRGALLEELCGYAYMPSTLSLFTNELKYAGAAPALWETHACTWHSSTQDWGSPRHAAVLYVDGTSKPIFTSMHSQSTHVSLYGRAMPGLDVVGFHSGYGVPLWYLAHSCRAPLVKAVPEAIASLERQLGADIGRIVVIDAEGNSAPFLHGLEQQQRGWVTRLRPSMVAGKLVINWTARRPYRENDRIREGELDLRLSKTEVLRVRLIEIERRGRGEFVHLAASKLLRVQDWKTAEVADLYFSRWPNQELDFRAVNQATGFKQVHGYGKQLVDNVAVTTRMDKVKELLQCTEAQRGKQHDHLEKIAANQRTRVKKLRADLARKDELDHDIDAILAAPAIDPNQARGLNSRRKATEASIQKNLSQIEATRPKFLEAEAKLERTCAKLQNYREQHEDLANRRKILAHDVELDSIFNVLKVGLTLLATYVLRKLLDNPRMGPTTFLDRIATLPARQRFTDEYEYITFEHNPRDPTTMALLTANCDRINALDLQMRNGRRLRVAIEPPIPDPRDSDSS